MMRGGCRLPDGRLPDGTPVVTRQLRRRELEALATLDERQERAGGELVEDLRGLGEDTLVRLSVRGLVTLLDRDGFIAAGVTPGGDHALARRGR